MVIACPCCGEPIEINVRTGKARASDLPKSKKAPDLEGLLEATKGEGARLNDLFEDAQSDQSTEKKRREDKFSKAREKAAKDKDKRPRNPFDLE